MGNALSAVSVPGSYAYYNPALSAIPADDIQIDISTAALAFDRRLHMVGIRIPLPPSAGLSFTLLNARVSEIDGRTTDGYHTGMLGIAEYQLLGNFAIRLTENVWTGIGIKYNHGDYHQQIPAATGIGLDAGILVRFSPNFQAAITLKDLLASFEIDSSELYGTDQALNNTQSFPVRGILGISWQPAERWLVSQDIELRFSSYNRLTGEVVDRNGFDIPITLRENQKDRSAFFRTGAQFEIHERFTLRSGLELVDAGGENIFQPAFGFSIHLPFDTYSPAIDYAIRREPGRISTMHVFAIRLDI